MKQARALLLSAVLFALTGCGAVSNSYSRPEDGTLGCGNFSSQESAQAYYDTGAYDASNLDGDSDGIACEGL